MKRACLATIAVLMAAGMLLSFRPMAAAQTENDPTDHGGPVMQSPTFVPIFWLPAGQHLDPSASDATFESLIVRFLGDLSMSSYAAIMTQYPSWCSPPAIPTTTPCFGPVVAAAPIVDATPYPHPGTSSSPLSDNDIQGEVSRVIASRGFTPGQNIEFIVFTGAGIQECTSFGCTESDFCAYHSSFMTSTGSVIYTYMPDVSSFGSACTVFSTSPNLLSADQEIEPLSHELGESWSDPSVDGDLGWVDSITGNEIGDDCNFVIGPTASDGSDITMNGHPYVVEELWSIDIGGCALSATTLAGPTIEFTSLTDGDNLRGDSSASVGLESSPGATFATDATHAQSQPSWDNDTTHARVFAFTPPSGTSLSDGSFSLTSHDAAGEANDTWKVESLDAKERNANGTLICEQVATGNPLAAVTDGSPFVFNTPLCIAPSPPPATPKFDRMDVSLQTGNDNADSGLELSAAMTGEGAFCMKPSTDATQPGPCTNGSGAVDQEGFSTWDDWHFTDLMYILPTDLAPGSSFGTFTITGTQAGCSLSCYNWDLQGMTITLYSSSGFLPRTTIFTATMPRDHSNDNNCLARIKAAPNATMLRLVLDGSNSHVYANGTTSEVGQSTSCANNGD